MFGAGNLRELPDLSKPPRTQAKWMAVIINGLKRDKIIKMNVLGHFCFYTPSERTDDKIALCVQGGGQAEDVPLCRASVSLSVHFTFPRSCPSALCSGSVRCAPPVLVQRGEPRGAAFH